MSMQQAPGLYISGPEEYAGFLAARPNIPQGEMWVFYLWNGENVVATREDGEYTPPPPPPWFKRRATKVYKFCRQTDYETTESYLTLTQYPTTIRWHVTLKLKDPLAFMDSPYQINNFPKIQADLVAALSPEVEEILMEQLNTVVVSSPYDSMPPPLEQVLTRRRFDDDVRSEFRSVGLELQVVAMDIQCPAYQNLKSRAALEPQLTMVDGHNRLITAATELQIALQRLNYEERYITSVVGQVREINPQYLALVQNAIAQIGNTPNPQVVINLVQQLLNLAPHPMQSPFATAAAGGRGAGKIPPLRSNVREQHIQALYQAAMSAGWTLLPDLNNVDDFIRLDLGGDREVELRVPRNYPIAKVMVSKVKRQGVRIPQSQVNQLTQVVINGPYDLVTLVQQLDNNIQ